MLVTFKKSVKKRKSPFTELRKDCYRSTGGERDKSKRSQVTNTIPIVGQIEYIFSHKSNHSLGTTSQHIVGNHKQDDRSKEAEGGRYRQKGSES